MELTERKSALEKEREVLFKRVSQESEAREKAVRDAKTQEKFAFSEKLESSERTVRELSSENGLLRERNSVVEEKLRALEERTHEIERLMGSEREKLSKKLDGLGLEHRRELKEIVSKVF